MAVSHVISAGVNTLSKALISDFDDGFSIHDNLGLFYGLKQTGLSDQDYASEPGDSGSPVFLNGKMAGVVSGAINFGNTPAAEDHGGGLTDLGALQVWTRASAYAAWVDQVVGGAYDLKVDLSIQPSGRDGGRADTVVSRFDTANDRFTLTVNGQVYHTDRLSNLRTVTLVGSADAETFKVEGRATIPFEVANYGDDLVTVNNAALEDDATLAATVSVGAGGVLSPGGAGVSGLISAYELNLQPNAVVDLDVGRDFIDVVGLDLGGATLRGRLSSAPTLGQRFTIMKSLAPPAGQFVGLPEGAVTTIDGYQMRITYRGGSSQNAVVLRYVGPSPTWDAGDNVDGRRFVANAGQPFEMTLTATDPFGYSMDYYIVNGPENATYHVQSGVFHFEPLASQSGRTFSFQIAASNGYSDITQSFTVEVRSADPSVGSLTASPGTILDNGTTVLTLTANDVSTPVGTINRVEFWLDRNGNRQVDQFIDNLMGTDEDGGDGYRWTGFLGGVSVGTETVMARARRYSYSDTFYSPAATASLTVVAAPPPVLEVKKLGGETRANGTLTGGWQQGGLVTADGAGNVYAFWNNYTGGQAYVQRYNQSGTALGSPVALQNVLGHLSDVDMLPNGRFAVVWDGNALLVKEFFADGTPVVASQAGAQVSDNYRFGSGRVSMRADGEFTVTYDHGSYFSESAYARSYLNGNFARNLYPAEEGTPGGTRASNVTYLSDGNFVVTYVKMTANGPRQAMARVLAPDGTPLTGPIRLSSRAAQAFKDDAYADDASTDVAPLPGGGFVAVWAAFGDNPHDNDMGIYARRFSAAGVPLDPADVLVNDGYVGGRQDSPAVEAAADGTFVVTWTSQGQDPGQGVNDSGVYGQLFGGDGAKRGDNFRVNTTLSGAQTARYSSGGLALAPEHRFVVGWEGNGAGDADGVFLQRFEIRHNNAPAAANAALTGVKNLGVAVDLRTLVTDTETPAERLTFAVRGAENGRVELLADGHTAWFTPDAGHTGAARFLYEAADEPWRTYPARTGGGAVDVSVLAALEEPDGDAVSVKLTGPGSAAVVVAGPEDGRGSIGRIVLRGTTAASVLTVSVAVGVAGDGRVDVGSISGGAVGRIVAPKANLVGAGVSLSGLLGSLQLADVRYGADILTGGKASQLTTLVLGTVGGGTVIETASRLARLAVAGDLRADAVRAPAVTALTVGGSTDTSLLIASGGLGSARVNGDLGDAYWDVRGPVGTVTVLGEVDGWTLSQEGGAVAALTLGQVLSADVNVAGVIQSVRVSGWESGALAAGGVVGLISSGDWKADVTLNGQGVKRGAPVLGSARVGGAVLDAVFALAGSVGSFRAGRFLDSRLYAGYTPFDEADPAAGGAFLSGSSVGSFRTTGLGGAEADFVGGVVAAAKVGAVKLNRVRGDNGGTRFGVLGEKVVSVVVIDPAFVYDPAAGGPQGWEDFVVALA